METVQQVLHTPGPWRAMGFHDDGLICAAAGGLIASVPCGDGFENMFLIAAAPDLLWCLKQIQAGETMTPELCLAIDSAINRAEGRGLQ